MKAVAIVGGALWFALVAEAGAAENINITVKVTNDTGESFTYGDRDLSWGKLKGGDVTNRAFDATADNLELFKAMGRANSSSGTEGWVEYIGPYGAKIRFSFEINWGADQNSCSVGCTNPAGDPTVCSAYRFATAKSPDDCDSSPSTMTVTISNP